ncbi:MAG: response regulator [Bilophila wadsworthia]
MGYPKKPVVLVVDDTIANIRILDDLLRGEYTVRVATNGATALRLALSEPRPDIVLLDIMMPDMDGYEVCRRLKSDPLTSNIAVVFITAMGNEEHEAKGLDLGAVDFIAKPFQPRLVRARVSNHVALKNTTMSSIRWSRTHQGTVSFPFRDGGMSRFGRGNPR